jgi:SAM-dependent methyltransferase
MDIFNNYARYYDLIYEDKDYIGESQFIHNLIQSNAKSTIKILELGCGTGSHAILLAEKGYQVHGVDISPEMLQYAATRCAQLPKELAARLQFDQGDIRQFRLSEKFDVVLSLFHVISYQTTNEDLLAAFETAIIHLKPGGIFIFDVWYGPAVLTDRPTTRVKRLEDEHIAVTRIAEPLMYPNENRVDVNYHIFIRDKHNTSIDELKETHQMRYIFKSEIDLLAQQLGLKVIECKEWMSDRDPGFDTWGVYFIIQQPYITP